MTYIALSEQKTQSGLYQTEKNTDNIANTLIKPRIISAQRKTNLATYSISDVFTSICLEAGSGK